MKSLLVVSILVLMFLESACQTAEVTSQIIWKRTFICILAGFAIAALIGLYKRRKPIIVVSNEKSAAEPSDSKKVLKSDLGIDPNPHLVELFLKQNNMQEAKFSLVLYTDCAICEYTAFLLNDEVRGVFVGQNRKDSFALRDRRKIAGDLYRRGEIRPIKTLQ